MRRGSFVDEKARQDAVRRVQDATSTIDAHIENVKRELAELRHERRARVLELAQILLAPVGALPTETP